MAAKITIKPTIQSDSQFDGVYLVDVDKHITFWNCAAERITGYSKSETAGRVERSGRLFDL